MWQNLLLFSSKKAPTVGVEPTTFGLEVQRASPLRHAGYWRGEESESI